MYGTRFIRIKQSEVSRAGYQQVKSVHLEGRPTLAVRGNTGGKTGMQRELGYVRTSRRPSGDALTSSNWPNSQLFNQIIIPCSALTLVPSGRGMNYVCFTSCRSRTSTPSSIFSLTFCIRQVTMMCLDRKLTCMSCFCTPGVSNVAVIWAMERATCWYSARTSKRTTRVTIRPSDTSLNVGLFKNRAQRCISTLY